MPTVNFYLNSLSKKQKESKLDDTRRLIFLQFKYSNKKLVYSFNQKVDPKNWNSKTKRVKNNKAATDDGLHFINDLLDNLAKACMKGYNQELANGIPEPIKLKKYLDDVLFPPDRQEDDKEDLFHLFDRFIAGEIKSRGRDKSKSTLQNYNTSKNHLLAYQQHIRERISYDSVNLDFFYKFTNFLKKQFKKPDKSVGLKHNTVVKTLTVLKTVMTEAVDLGYTSNMQYRHKKFSLSEESTDAVYLTEKEIIKLYRHNLESCKRLEQTRDLFVVGCFTGLRYSDYSNIGPNNIVEKDGDLYIKMITQKTKELVIIPCNPIVLEIFKKYESNSNRLPRAISGQKFNDYVKEVCQKAELTEKGRLSTNPDMELWECISSHTARRSFATNLYLEGFPSHEIMKITGHRSEASFRKYIKVSKLETAKRLSDHIKKTWSSKTFKDPDLDYVLKNEDQWVKEKVA